MSSLQPKYTADERLNSLAPPEPSARQSCSNFWGGEDPSLTNIQAVVIFGPFGASGFSSCVSRLRFAGWFGESL